MKENSKFPPEYVTNLCTKRPVKPGSLSTKCQILNTSENNKNLRLKDVFMFYDLTLMKLNINFLRLTPEVQSHEFKGYSQ